MAWPGAVARWTGRRGLGGPEAILHPRCPQRSGARGVQRLRRVVHTVRGLYTCPAPPRSHLSHREEEGSPAPRPRVAHSWPGPPDGDISFPSTPGPWAQAARSSFRTLPKSCSFQAPAEPPASPACPVGVREPQWVTARCPGASAALHLPSGGLFPRLCPRCPAPRVLGFGPCSGP